MWEVVIGLETHVQLATRTKMFCACPVQFGAPPNSLTCPVCLGMPGTLPVINRRAVELGAAIAGALHCTINPDHTFVRKQYFYPDAPKNYQLSQGASPLGTDGWLEVASRRIQIERLHLEEDVGKLLHDEATSRVDFNRAGTPLAEIVSKPDMHTPEEAETYMRGLYAVVTGLGACEGRMERAHFRGDANISLHRSGEPLGTKVEVKNINSFKFTRRALAYEIERQTNLLDAGVSVVQETRRWDDKQNVTTLMRSKERQDEYLYFQDPDLRRS